MSLQVGGKKNYKKITCFGTERCLVAKEDPATIYGPYFVRVCSGRATPQTLHGLTLQGDN